METFDRTKPEDMAKLKTMMDEKGKVFRKKPVAVRAFQTDKELIIHTPEGDEKANVGDFIIEGVFGEMYPCKPEIFKKTYSGTYKPRTKKEGVKNGEQT